MKRRAGSVRFILGLLLLATFGLALFATLTREAVKPSPQETAAAKIIRYYQTSNADPESWGRDVAWIHAVTKTVFLWCDRLGYQGQEEWVLALIATESNFDPFAKGPVGERGLGQATEDAADFFGARLNKRGWDSNLDDSDWQIALTVAEYGYHLERAAGDNRLAAYAYNGRGASARRHAAKVTKFRFEAFRAG